MRIGLLLPSILAAQSSLSTRIFAPLAPAIDLANGLVGKGHEVFFYGPSDVTTTAKVIGGNDEYLSKDLSYYQFRDREEKERIATEKEIKKRDFENALTMKAYKDAKEGKIDLIHSYHDFAAHYFDELTGIPTIYTLHNPLPQSDDTIEYERFKTFSHHHYVSISMSQRKSILDLHFAANIYHGIDPTLYKVGNGGEELVFIGRLIPDKGAGIALQVAKELDMGLAIATSSSAANRNEVYYNTDIAPHLDEKRKIVDGMFDADGKSAFLGNAKAFLFPLQWEEPFGLVIVEAMAAGTPVIAFARGSAPELIVDGVNGFLVSTDENRKGQFLTQQVGMEGMKEAVQRLYSMPESEYRQMRMNARAHVEEKFSVGRMVDEYEALYQKILNK